MKAISRSVGVGLVMGVVYGFGERMCEGRKESLVILFRGAVGDCDLHDGPTGEGPNVPTGEIPVENVIGPFVGHVDAVAVAHRPVAGDDGGVPGREARDLFAVRLPVGQADPSAVHGLNRGGGGAGEGERVGGGHGRSIRVRGANVSGGVGNFSEFVSAAIGRQPGRASWPGWRSVGVRKRSAPPDRAPPISRPSPGR